MICQRPPSRSGASASPYFRSGGAMLICHRFQVGPSAAPQTISAVPSSGEEDRRDPEEADVERPHPEVEQISADQRAAADAVFSFKAEHGHRRILRSGGTRSAASAQHSRRRTGPGVLPGPRPLPSASDATSAAGGAGAGHAATSATSPWRARLVRAFQPVEAVGAEQDEMDHQRQHEQEGEQRDQRPAADRKEAKAPHVLSSYAMNGMTVVTARLHAVDQRRVALRARQPGTPLPRQECAR